MTSCIFQKHKKEIARYQGRPCWVAIDTSDSVVTFADLPEIKNCNFKNAHDFIIAQLITVDSIAEFAEAIGYENQEAAMFQDFVWNDRNLDYWRRLAIDWFNAKYMGYAHE